MANDKVWITYTDSSLCAKNGIKPVEVSISLAEHYENRGLAKILNRPPKKALPPPKQPDIVEAPEEKNLSKVTWVTTTYADRTLLKVAEKLGFKVEVQTPMAFSMHRLLASELIIVESNLRGFTHNQLDNLRAIQYQKQVPFVFRVIYYETSDEFKENLMHAKLITFTNDKYLENAQELYGNLFHKYYMEKEDDYYAFWREIDKIMLRPQNVGTCTNKSEPPKPVELPKQEEKGFMISEDIRLAIVEGKMTKKEMIEYFKNVGTCTNKSEEDDSWIEELVASTVKKEN